MWAEAGLVRAAVAYGDLDGAIAHYQRAVETLPLPELLVAMGETQEAAGRSNDAAATYELVRAMQALYADSGVKVELELALFEANHGDPVQAVALARQAFADQPNVKAADALAWALHRAGSVEEAADYSELATRLGPPIAGHAFRAGMIALARDDADTARRHLNAALDAGGMLSALDAAKAQATIAELER